ncbi:hypothetical protein [Methylobacterium sp. R2-1]|uniref:hypothetical protein n=1 Tax=Methylobacterium sp. R2-1 TaxID=2587064 RepID=UPI0017EB848F|nr:hypothetical protein [Methylobacterium sp. R2-1]MBB2964880.1 hypothetical protein [Methylobacterium sp. R2-1]
MRRPDVISNLRRSVPTLLVVLAVVLDAGHGAAAAALPAAPETLLSLPLPPIRLLTILVGLHLLGLCFGLGGATMLDFWILRWMRWGGLPNEITRTFLFVSKVVTVGLILLWVSGLGFLAVYAFEAPEKLSNPKIVAKITVVAALTVNGWLIHAFVLPGVLRDVSRPMFDGVSHLRTGIFLISGAVSGVSWYTAFALGLMRELNGRVAASLLLALWLAAMVAAGLAAYAFWQFLRRRSLGARTGGGPDNAEAEPVSGLPFWGMLRRRIGSRLSRAGAGVASMAASPTVDLHDREGAEAVAPHPMRAVPLGFTCARESRMAALKARLSSI